MVVVLPKPSECAQTIVEERQDADVINLVQEATEFDDKVEQVQLKTISFANWSFVYHVRYNTTTTLHCYTKLGQLNIGGFAYGRSDSSPASSRTITITAM